jgi:hypothetical protein
MWGEVYEPLVDDQWPHNPHFFKNSHERPFSIIPMPASRDRGVPKPMSECAACPSPDGSSAWASAKGGSEVAGDGRERGGNLAAFVFVPRPGRVRLQ